MSHSFIKIHIHAVFSTKGRRKIIPKDFQPQLWSYMAGICRNQGMTPIAINGMDDHAHVLFNMPPTLSMAAAVRLIKANSSKWMNEQSDPSATAQDFASRLRRLLSGSIRCCGVN
jgi:putative transposase